MRSGALLWFFSLALAAAQPLFDADVMIPMRDGTKLAANIFRPAAEGKYPTILMRSPYGKFDEKFGDGKRYAAAGYVLVIQDCRGRGKSEGPWDPFRYDPEDGFDTQEWIGRQSWSNGEIGTAGGSYLGWTQWASAPNASRHLKAMVPVVPFGNTFEDIAYPGGAFQLALLMGWGSSVAGAKPKTGTIVEAYRHLPLQTFATQMNKSVDYLGEWLAHSDDGDYWKRRSINRRYADVTVPILNIGGWYDIFSKATIELVDKVREHSRDLKARRNQFVIMGPWAHNVAVRKVGELDFGEDARVNLGELQLKWFEYWLKGKDTGVQDWPAYRLFVMGENRWRDEHEWPLKRTRFTPYYLRTGRALNTAKPEAESPDTFTYDPADPVPSHGGNNLVGATAGPLDQSKIEERADVLSYSTEPLPNDVEVTGPIELILYAASSARDTDFTAKLVDVHPDGKAFNLCEGIIRARYAGEGKPQLLEPGKAREYRIDLWVTSNLFKAGHRIRVEVSSSNFPRFDRNPNTGKTFGSDTELVKAQQTIYHDAEHASHLILPVIPR